jgi:uncharacterized protein (TIGR02246 family)
MRHSITLLLVLLVAPCHAHRDTFIMWNDDGTLERLPAEYQPAKLAVNFSSGPGSKPGIRSFSLTISGKTTSLPACLTNMVRSPGKQAVQLLSSWYHDLTSHPPYLFIEFHDSDPKAKLARKSVSFHFDLTTGRLQSVSTADYTAGDMQIQDADVDVGKLCSKQELAPIMEGAAVVSDRPPADAERMFFGFVKAFENLDFDKVIGSFAEDATMFFPTPEPPQRFDGREAIREHYKVVFEKIRRSSSSTVPPFQRLEPEQVAWQVVSPDTVVVTFHLRSDQRLARRTLVLSRREGAWVVVHLHASNVSSSEPG